MERHLRYGPNSELCWEPPSGAVLADLSQPVGRPLDDPTTAVMAALAAPVGFPPLRQAVVPEDRVVVAIDRDLPQPEAVIAGIVETLVGGVTHAEDITLLLADRTATAPTSCLPPDLAQAISVARHDPRDRRGLAYLAASKDARPIYVNRLLFDADVIVPVVCLHPRAALGYLGFAGGLYPGFSDEDAQQRFRTPDNVESEAAHRQRRKEAEEAAWLLGVRFSCQIVPGVGESILHVVAGDVEAVAKRGRALCEAAWRYRVPRRASLVVATIAGPQAEQTWENFARALSSAAAVVADGGEIVLCTSLQCAPGPALRRLTEGEQNEKTLRAIRRERSPDALSAALLWEVRQRHRVYLLSELDEETVEDLGLGYVSCGEEVGHLSQHHDSCILLGDAHRAVVELTGEDEAQK
jgi:nickel-dependent lactate racemase